MMSMTDLGIFGSPVTPQFIVLPARKKSRERPSKSVGKKAAKKTAKQTAEKTTKKSSRTMPAEENGFQESVGQIERKTVPERPDFIGSQHAIARRLSGGRLMQGDHFDESFPANVAHLNIADAARRMWRAFETDALATLRSTMYRPAAIASLDSVAMSLLVTSLAIKPQTDEAQQMASDIGPAFDPRPHFVTILVDQGFSSIRRAPT
jgi:hypothetical protein